MMRARMAPLCAALCLFALPQAAWATEHAYALIIGNNAPPSDGPEDPNDALQPLRYADDDAASMYLWTQTLTEHAILLTRFDPSSASRFAALVEQSRPPTRAEVMSAVAELRTHILQDTAAGDTSVLYLYISGHGRAADATHPASLTLQDAPLDQHMLYEEVLAMLPATTTHLWVDACHAEAVLQPRDASAHVVSVSSADTQRWLQANTLARFPHVGAVIASTSDAEAFEWDVYELGVFTHQMLSALRGVADVNGDGRVEYSELHAYLLAANHSVENPRARIAVRVDAPLADPHAALVDISRMRHVGWAVGMWHGLRRFYIEDLRGNRLVDEHLEAGQFSRLAVPAGVQLFLRNDAGEAPFILSAGEQIDLAALPLRPLSMRVKGATSWALKRGLYATPFGASYYRAMVAISGEAPVAPAQNLALPLPSPRPAISPLWIAPAAGAAASLACVAVMGAAYHDWNSTNLQHNASVASNRYYGARTGLFISLGATVLSSAAAALVQWWVPADEANGAAADP